MAQSDAPTKKDIAPDKKKADENTQVPETITGNATDEKAQAEAKLREAAETLAIQEQQQKFKQLYQTELEKTGIVPAQDKVSLRQDVSEALDRLLKDRSVASWEKLETAVKKLSETGDRPAQGLKDWVSTEKTLARLATSSGDQAKALVEELITSGRGGNLHAQSAVARILVAGAGDSAVNDFYERGHGFVEAKLSLVPDLSRFKTASPQIFDEIRDSSAIAVKEFVQTNGSNSQSDAPAQALVLALGAEAQSAGPLELHLQTRVDELSATTAHETLTAALRKAIDQKSSGASTLADTYMRHAALPDLARDLPELARMAASKNPEAIRILVDATRYGAEKGDIADRSRLVLSALADDPQRRKMIVEALIQRFNQSGDGGQLLSTLGQIGSRDEASLRQVRETLYRGLSAQGDDGGRTRASAAQGMIALVDRWDAVDVANLVRRPSPELASAIAAQSHLIPRDRQKDLLTLGLARLDPQKPVPENERFFAIRMVSALARYAGNGQVDSLSRYGDSAQTATTLPPSSQRPIFQKEAANALLNVYQRAEQKPVSEKARQTLSERTWGPMMPKETRDELIAYAEGARRDEDLKATTEAVDAGLRPSDETVIQNLAALDRPAEVKDQPAPHQPQSDEKTRAVAARLIMYNSLPPEFKKELTGSDKPVNPEEVARQLRDGTLQDGPHKFLLKDLKADVTRLKDTNQQTVTNLTKELEEINKRKQALSKELAEHTKEGLSLWTRVQFWSDKTDKYAEKQSNLVKQIREMEKQIAEKNKVLEQASARVQLLELGEKNHEHARLMQDGKIKEADRMAVEMWGKYGDQLKQLSPQIWRELTGPGTFGKTAFSRLKEAGETYNGKLPVVTSQDGKNFESGLAALKTLDPALKDLKDTDPVRTQALRAVDSDEKLTNLVDASRKMSEKLPVLQDMFASGLEGTKFEDFVKDARARANEIDKVMKEMEPHVKDVRARIEELKKAQAETTDETARQELKKRVDALEQSIKMFDPTTPEGRQLANMVKVINSPNFDENTFLNWLKKEGVVIGVCIAAAVATVATLGAGAPLLLVAAASAGAALVAKEITNEALYHLDIGLGTGERSKIGAYIADDKVVDLATGEERDRALWGDVVAPYATEYAIGFATTFATMGLGRLAVQGTNSVLARMGQSRATAFVTRNADEFRTMVTRTETIKQVAGKGGETWGKNFTREVGEEFAEEAKGAFAEDALQRSIGKANGILGFASSVAVGVVTGGFHKGVRMDLVKGGNAVNVHTPDLSTFNNVIALAERNGYRVQRGSEGQVELTSPEGHTFKAVARIGEGDGELPPPSLSPDTAGETVTPAEPQRPPAPDRIEERGEVWERDQHADLVRDSASKFNQAFSAGNFEEAVAIARGSAESGGPEINYADVEINTSDLFDKTDPAKTDQESLTLYLQFMQEPAGVSADRKTVIIPRPLLVLSDGARVDIFGKTLDGTTLTADQKAEVDRVLSSDAGKRLQAEQALTVLEEVLVHKNQMARDGQNVISPTYAQFLQKRAQALADDGRRIFKYDGNAADQEQEVIAMLYDSGMPLSMIKHHFGNRHVETRKPIIEFIEKSSPSETTELPRPAVVAGTEVDPNAKADPVREVDPAARAVNEGDAVTTDLPFGDVDPSASPGRDVAVETTIAKPFQAMEFLTMDQLEHPNGPGIVEALDNAPADGHPDLLNLLRLPQPLPWMMSDQYAVRLKPQHLQKITRSLTEANLAKLGPERAQVVNNLMRIANGRAIAPDSLAQEEALNAAFNLPAEDIVELDDQQYRKVIVHAAETLPRDDSPERVAAIDKIITTLESRSQHGDGRAALSLLDALTPLELRALPRPFAHRLMNAIEDPASIDPRRRDELILGVRNDLASAPDSVPVNVLNRALELSSLKGSNSSLDLDVVNSVSAETLGKIDTVHFERMVRTLSKKELSVNGGQDVVAKLIGAAKFHRKLSNTTSQEIIRLTEPELLRKLSTADRLWLDKELDAQLERRADNPRKQALKRGEFSFAESEGSRLKDDIKTIVDRGVDQSPMTDAQIEAMLDKFGADRAKALQVLSDRADYLSFARLRDRLRILGDELSGADSKKAIGRGLEVKEINVIVTGNTSAGHDLAYQFRKATGISVKFHVIEPGKPLPRLLEQGNYVMFDAAPKPGDPGYAQYQALKGLDINVIESPIIRDFHNGPNLHDVLASTSEPTGDRLTNAIKRSLEGDAYHSASPPPMASEMEVKRARELISGFDQKARDLRSTQTKLFLIHQDGRNPPVQPELVARMMTSRGIYDHMQPREMMNRLRGARDVLKGVPGIGPDLKNAIFVTDADDKGSPHSMIHLFRLANGMDGPEFDAQFKTLTEIKLLGKDARDGKRFVHIDDVVYSGATVRARVEKISKRLGLDLSLDPEQVVFVSTGGYAKGIEYAMNYEIDVRTVPPYFMDVNDFVLAEAEAGRIRRTLEGKEDEPKDAAGQLTDIMKDGWADVATPVKPDAAPKVVAGLSLPYMVANNNSRLVQTLGRYWGLPSNKDATRRHGKASEVDPVQMELDLKPVGDSDTDLESTQTDGTDQGLSDIARPDSSDLAAIGGRGGGRKLWWPQRDITKLNANERSALIRELEKGRSPMSYPDSVDSFLDRALPALSGWKTDYKPLARDLDAAKKEFDKRAGEYQALIDPLFGNYPLTDIHNTDFVRQVFAGEPAKLAVLEQYVAAREAYSSRLSRLNETIDVRRAELQQIVDQYTDLHGLPRVEIKLSDPNYMVTEAASYNDGLIKLNRNDLLNNQNTSDLIGHIYHELTHNEQEATIVRKAADDLKVGTAYNNKTIEDVQRLYQQRTGRLASTEHIAEILRVRNGIELTIEDAARADVLADAWKKNQSVKESYRESENDYRVVNSWLSKLENDAPNASYLLMEALARDKSGVLARRLFDGGMPPAEVQRYILLYRKDLMDDDTEVQHWTKERGIEARQLMIEQLQGRIDGINRLRAQAYDQYMQFHEYDAWYAGERSRIRAMERGATAGLRQQIDGITWEVSEDLQNINPGRRDD